MSSPKLLDFLQQCTHLKSEWIPISSTQESQHPHYQHTFSLDFSQGRSLSAVSMKELDLYSSREAYTYPFCPRIYKYIIEKNRQNGNELIFDITILVEKVPGRLNNNFLNQNNEETTVLLGGKVVDIVKGFQYLFRRFGSFGITEEMIGLTELGVVKVWFNEDYSLNTKAIQSLNEETMIQCLVSILQKKQLMKNVVKNCSSFESLLQSIRKTNKRKDSDIEIKPTAFRPIDNLNASVSIFRGGIKTDKIFEIPKSPQSRKHITFSYSTKDIEMQQTAPMSKTPKKSCISNKRTSMEIDPLQLKQMLQNPNNSSSISIGVRSPSSLSANGCNPIVRRGNKKLSQFSHYFPGGKDNQFKVKTLDEHFSKTTQSSLYNKDVPHNYQNLKIGNNHHQEINETLHYSTSSNPITKFFKNKKTEGKTYSTKGSHHQNGQEQCQIDQGSKIGSNESPLSQKTLELRVKEEVKGVMQTFQIQQQQVNLRESQEVQKDLDALFNSDHSFDCNELQNELDCIL